MRTSLLSRSVIAVASLAIGSAALSTTSATASTDSGITRDRVITLASEVREAKGATPSFVHATLSTLLDLVGHTCDFEQDFEQDRVNYFDYLTARSVGPAGGSADGLIIDAGLVEYSGGRESVRECTFAVLATADPAFALSGDVSMTIKIYDPAERAFLAPVTTTSKLSGDVFVTSPFNYVDDIKYIGAGSLSATGNATRPFNVTTTEKVAIPKSKAAKKSAKKTYDKLLKAAKKSYAKAVKKAGGSKSKKATAKKAYNKKKTTAKTKYKKAIATSKTVVTKTTAQTETRPFSLSGSYEYKL